MIKSEESQINRMKELMNFGKSDNSSSISKSVEYQKKAADGKTYGVIREGSKYFIEVSDKTPIKDKSLIREDFNFIGGFMNKKAYQYDSYAKALKSFDLVMMDIKESVEGKTSNIITESWDPNKKIFIKSEDEKNMRLELNRQHQIMENVSKIDSKNEQSVTLSEEKCCNCEDGNCSCGKNKKKSSFPFTQKAGCKGKSRCKDYVEEDVDFGEDEDTNDSDTENTKIDSESEISDLLQSINDKLDQVLSAEKEEDEDFDDDDLYDDEEENDDDEDKEGNEEDIDNDDDDNEDENGEDTEVEIESDDDTSKNFKEAYKRLGKKLCESVLHDFGNHPRFGKEPIHFKNTEGGTRYGKKIGKGIPFEVDVKDIENSIAESLSRHLKKK